MSNLPRDALQNALAICFFVTRQGLWITLEKQAVAQLPHGHDGISFIRHFQPVLSHLLGVYTLIVRFFEAGNHNDPTWTPADKHWYWVSEYQKKWTAIEKVLRDSALICSARDEERAAASARFFMTGDVVKCNFGFYFFDRLLSKDVHENIHELFDDIEAFCRAVEQECVQSRT